MKETLRKLAAALPSAFALNPGDLSEERSVRKYLLRGYQFDYGLARLLEDASGVTGFQEAVRQAWARTVRCSTHGLSEAQLEASILEELGAYIESTSPDYEGSYREDKIAEHLQSAVKGIGGGYNTYRLGKLLSKHGIGYVRTCRISDGDRIGAMAQKYSVVFFSEEDLVQLKEVIARLEDYGA
jgi:hypothetical protein